MRGGDCASAEIVRCLSSPERQLHMRVRVNSARNDEFSARIDDNISFHFERFADNRNRFVFD